MVKVIHPIEKRINIGSQSLFTSSLKIEEAAWQTGFYKKKPKKITASALFMGFFRMLQSKRNTLKTWALSVGLEVNETVTDQSVNERLNAESCDMAETILCNAFNFQLDNTPKAHITANRRETIALFNRILVRDSTTVKLPDELRHRFKGGFSHTGSSCVARIQALFDYTNQKWLQFKLGSYTDNDQSAARCIVEDVQENDLILQDLGYFTLDWLEELGQKAFVITKWKSGTNLYTLEGEKINLAFLLSQNHEVDTNVLVGAKKRLPMRLVAKKLPKKEAAKRLKKAKENRHSQANHSEEYFELLKYEIYLTNIKTETLNGFEIAKLYGLRWHIEILFKSWKSFSGFKMIFSKGNMQEHRVVFSLYAFLIEYVWLQNIVAQRMNLAQKKSKKLVHISTLKFMDISSFILYDLMKVNYIQKIDHFIPHLMKHAVYDKRRKWKNIVLKFLYINELCNVNS